MRLILGSGSARRRDLLAQIGVTPSEIQTPEIDEHPNLGESPKAYLLRIVAQKAAALPPKEGEAVLCADTIIALGRRILGKPAGRAEAERFLRLLNGRRHCVITALRLTRQDRYWQKTVTTKVKIQSLSGADLQAYLDSNEWCAKAGGYAIQGRIATFIPWISGSYSNVVGLPLRETALMLRAAGIAMPIG